MVLSENILGQCKLWHDHSTEQPSAVGLLQTSGTGKTDGRLVHKKSR